MGSWKREIQEIL
jgi:hypothetical protein